jgi:hypothetical protein
MGSRAREGLGELVKDDPRLTALDDDKKDPLLIVRAETRVRLARAFVSACWRVAQEERADPPAPGGKITEQLHETRAAGTTRDTA